MSAYPKTFQGRRLTLLLGSLFECLEGESPITRDTVLTLFSMAHDKALELEDEGLIPLDHPFSVTPQDFILNSQAGTIEDPEAAMESLRRSMPALTYQHGALATARGTGLPLFDIVRTLYNSQSGMTFLWWVRPGQWAHWGLSNDDRWFLCRLLKAIKQADSEELRAHVRELGLSIAMAKGSGIDHREVSLNQLLWHKGKGLSEFWGQVSKEARPPLLIDALHQLEEVGLIASFGDQPEKSKRTHASRRPPWLGTTITVDPR